MKGLKNNNLNYYSWKKILKPPCHVVEELKILLNLLSKNKNLKIVDFGAGGGRLTIPLLKRGFQVLAVDIDKNARKQLKKLALKLGFIKKLKITKSLEKNKKYDYIIGTDVLHHINIKKYFSVFKRHLNKNGKIIFSEPNLLNISWLIFISLFLNWREEKGIFQCSYFYLKNYLKKTG
ncbi:MAG: class I SAM-dependent methyltransferase, partial [Patescibacteria group bacterium]|nr:class I SAM-dependent methyltransferase [Patescibacteria group bacterium]